MAMSRRIREAGVARFSSALVRADALPGEDLTQAAERAAAEALASLDRQPDLACIFVSGSDAEEMAEAGERAARRAGAAATIGCSAHGVIGKEDAVELAPAVSVWLGVLPGIRLRTFHLGVVRASDSLAVLGMPDVIDDDAVGVLIGDPWTFPIDGFVELSNEVLPGLPLIGGLASGPAGSGGGSTWLCQDGVSYDDGAVGVLIGGDVDVATIVSQGCRPVGPTMVVTKAEGNELLELAGTPATEKLQEIVRELNPEDRELAFKGLQIGIAMNEYAEEHERGDFLIRGVGGLDPQRQSIVVGDIVEVGRTVRFQVRDAAAADEELTHVLAQFRRHVMEPEAALLFTCNGRGRAMFPTPDHDVRVVARCLGIRDVAGFFAAGEIGPVGGRNHLHGFTASLLAFGGARSAGAGR
jgi:small ligand-binding sensory domain FIST